ncbi:hypothetical protein BESB_004460 [Besnoitia besnoiti]|uniref:UAA transporter family protein n=1 Tax=Besnoitia besnoiti TaxID=94643 RepID=A0A2A9MJF7_BESBE|nr:hypothetical protein BESB_004460 [Besnoitia besnoiti]PFH38105.1 hypothetical protein BESB_004460 [Besnoitia besnoiti]
MERSSTLSSVPLVAATVLGMFVPYVFSGLAQRRLYDAPLSSFAEREASLSPPLSASHPSSAASPAVGASLPSPSASASAAFAPSELAAASLASREAAGAHEPVAAGGEAFRFTFTMMALNCLTAAAVAFAACLLLRLLAPNRARGLPQEAGEPRRVPEGRSEPDASEKIRRHETAPAGACADWGTPRHEGRLDWGRRRDLRTPARLLLSRAAWSAAFRDVSADLAQKYLVAFSPFAAGSKICGRWASCSPDPHWCARPQDSLRVESGSLALRRASLLIRGRVRPLKGLGFAFAWGIGKALADRRFAPWRRVSFLLPQASALGFSASPAPSLLFSTACRSHWFPRRGADSRDAWRADPQGEGGIDSACLSSTLWQTPQRQSRSRADDGESEPLQSAFPLGSQPTELEPADGCCLAPQSGPRLSSCFHSSSPGFKARRTAPNEGTDAQVWEKIRRELFWISLCTFAAKAAGFHSLTVVDFATVAVAKCAKPVAVLILSAWLGRKASRRELLGVVWISLWVYVFNASSAAGKSKKGEGADAADASPEALYAAVGWRLLGNGLVLGTLLLDSFSISRQDHVLLQHHRLCPYELMLVSNVYGLLFSLAFCLTFEGFAGFRFFFAPTFSAWASQLASSAQLTPRRGAFVASSPPPPVFLHPPSGAVWPASLVAVPPFAAPPPDSSPSASAPSAHLWGGEGPVLSAGVSAAAAGWWGGAQDAGEGESGEELGFGAWALACLSLGSLSPLACGLIAALGSAVSQLCGSKCLQLAGAVCSSVLTTLRRVALVLVAVLLQKETLPGLAFLAVANICLAAVLRLVSSLGLRQGGRCDLAGAPAGSCSPGARLSAACAPVPLSSPSDAAEISFPSPSWAAGGSPALSAFLCLSASSSPSRWVPSPFPSAVLSSRCAHAHGPQEGSESIEAFSVFVDGLDETSPQSARVGWTPLSSPFVRACSPFVLSSSEATLPQRSDRRAASTLETPAVCMTVSTAASSDDEEEGGGSVDEAGRMKQREETEKAAKTQESSHAEADVACVAEAKAVRG